ncbi:uncharacterized protein LOC123257405 [Drosophila ananassae]|uniref:uncharacterized protein LOC123257405 n=1 Tax=Drosophila ananassae TaxID=7217 RepID=UPI001CFFBEB4|nr:uncharacterized protein LOC123257405 [Drosophila ananassae]
MTPARLSLLAIFLLYINGSHNASSFHLPDDMKERLGNALKAKPILLNGILLTVENVGETLIHLSKVPRALIEVLRPIFAPIKNETMAQTDCGILHWNCKLKKIMHWS